MFLWLAILFALGAGVYFFWDMLTNLWHHDFSAEAKKRRGPVGPSNPWYNARVRESPTSTNAVSLECVDRE